MEISVQALTEQLSQKGIRPSYQRIRVLEYLHRKEGGHPTAEEIYDFLVNEIPALSKTTIYNTIHTLTEAGLVRTIHIDNDEARYDITLHNHGHFQCVACGSITNFPIDIDRVQIDELSHFEVREKNVYFRGLCPNCLNPTSEEKELLK